MQASIAGYAQLTWWTKHTNREVHEVFCSICVLFCRQERSSVQQQQQQPSRAEAPSPIGDDHWQPQNEEVLRTEALSLSANDSDRRNAAEAAARNERNWLVHLAPADVHKRALSELAVYESLTPLHQLVAATRILALVNLQEAVKREACWHRFNVQVRCASCHLASM